MANQTMTTANKELVEEFIRRVFNEHNADATPDYFSPEVLWHGGTLGTIAGSDAMTRFYKDLFAALPDLHATTSTSSPMRTRSGAVSLSKERVRAASSASPPPVRR
jgi:predicted SnoaL-like aldol condensation-catalyzing enzyme